MDEFDAMLYQTTAQMPTVLTQQTPPNPWKTTFRRITWGLILINITLNFWNLDLLLPAVGATLLWLGLRSLRQTNAGFRFAYGCTTVYALLRIAVLLLQATPLDQSLSDAIAALMQSSPGSTPFAAVLRAAALQLTLTLAVAGLWRGLKSVFAALDRPRSTAPAGALVLAEALLLPLGIIGLEGWLLVGPVLLLYLCLIWNLHKLGKVLDEAGYALTPAPTRLSSIAAFALWLGIPVAALLLLSLLFARLPVEALSPVVTEQSETSAVYSELLEQGYSADALSVLPEELWAALEDTYGMTQAEQTALSEGDEVPDHIPAVNMLELPLEDDTYGFRTVYLAYLNWSAAEVSGGGMMEGLRVTPGYHGITMTTTKPSGMLVWRDADGALQTAALTFTLYTDDSLNSAYYADFSLPRGVDGPVEGWVYWAVASTTPEEMTIYYYQLAYAHRLTFWQYPYELPSQALRDGDTGLTWRFNWHYYTGVLAPADLYTTDLS
jgi:hypothetical protein